LQSVRGGSPTDKRVLDGRNSASSV
jgi:hypothetical protein